MRRSPLVPDWDDVPVVDAAEPSDAESTHDGIPPEDEVG